ncbi:hypothetical protein ACQ4PT_001814 [Festuca glaucescens]
MDEANVAQQLTQMADFIRNEAVEKASEIEAAAAEEFQIEKLQLVEAEKKKIRQEYERKEKQVDIKKKIEYAMQLNASRIEVLQAQDDLVKSMMESAGKELLYQSQDHQSYKKLLRILIVQSLLRLKESAVILRCREEDLQLVESVLESAGNEYAERANVYRPEIVLDRQVFLPSAPSHYKAHDLSCSGGVVLASRDGKIVFENTLDARLELAFRKKLPEIRQSLIGQLINPQSGDWDVPMVSSMFDLDDTNAIFSIDVCDDKEDWPAWHFDPKGDISVKAAYRLGSKLRDRKKGKDAACSRASAENSVVKFGWNNIWDLKGPNKLKMFVWHVAHNSLASRMKIHRIGVDLDTRCPICNRLDEDGGHIFLKCKRVKEC